MNSFINVLLLLVSFPTMLVAIFVGFDLPLEFLGTTGARLPFRNEIFLGLGLALLVISLFRTVRRWMGIRMTAQTSKFAYSTFVSSGRKTRIWYYTLLESAVLFSLAYGWYTLTPEAWFPASVLAFFGAENVFFILVNRNRFRVGLTSKAILVSDREVALIYLKGLRQVSISQQTIYFDYIQQLQLTFPLDCVPESEKAPFFEALKSKIDRDKVLFRVEP